jgi:hypothetical protein
MSYCDFATGHEFHGPYHDREYGFPLKSDADLFERLMLEINQAASPGSPFSRSVRPFAERTTTLIRRLWRPMARAIAAGCWPKQEGMGQALQTDLPIHRR